MVMASFIPAEEEEEKTGESGTSTSKTTISINDAAAAFETVYDFLQQGDIEISVAVRNSKISLENFRNSSKLV